ncbi:MAG: hypothetical protein Q9217_005495 [Psora testacea]
MLAPRSLSSKLDVPHCTKMALVHDMGESLVGDITPIDGVTKEEKGRRERETMQFLGKGLLGNYDGGMQGEELQRIWEEYENGETMEARFVKDVDKLELLLQMMEYERRGEGRLDLSEFVWVAEGVRMDEAKTWCDELLAEREAFWKGIGKTVTGVANVPVPDAVALGPALALAAVGFMALLPLAKATGYGGFMNVDGNAVDAGEMGAPLTSSSMEAGLEAGLEDDDEEEEEEEEDEEEVSEGVVLVRVNCGE